MYTASLPLLLFLTHFDTSLLSRRVVFNFKLQFCFHSLSNKTSFTRIRYYNDSRRVVYFCWLQKLYTPKRTRGRVKKSPLTHPNSQMCTHFIFLSNETLMLHDCFPWIDIWLSSTSRVALSLYAFVSAAC